MVDGSPERFARLSGQGPPAGVRDRSGDDERHLRAAFLAELSDRENRRFGIQGVEYGFEQQQVRAVIKERFGRLVIVLLELLERHVAETGIVHVGREARRAVGGPQHTRHEARPVGRCELVRALPRDPGGGRIQLRCAVDELVVALGDSGGVEAVGLDDVRARVQIGAMDVGDQFGTGQIEGVVVAFQRSRMVLEDRASIVWLVETQCLKHGSVGTIEEQDVLLESLGQDGLGRHWFLGSICV